MDMLKYELKSLPGKSIDVPAEYAVQASELVRLAMENPADVPNHIDEFPCLCQPGIMGRTGDVMQDPSLKNQDALYLRVCAYHVAKGGYTSDAVFQLENDIIDMVREVESQQLSQ